MVKPQATSIASTLFRLFLQQSAGNASVQVKRYVLVPGNELGPGQADAASSHEAGRNLGDRNSPEPP